MLQLGSIKPCHGIKELFLSQSSPEEIWKVKKSAEEVVEWYNCTSLHLRGTFHPISIILHSITLSFWSLGTNHLLVTNIRARDVQLEPKRIHSSSLRHFDN
ncbi:hypothetical protein T10_1331 [Trichinella papuae]|uniref:Uncharacterized protein n=1 Tax=Trichinella papuae TaxID=268474 RepID=A0A0V1MH98_9BILA|nr:hypothetical protein T10_1331 [Trichinella papuae]